MGRVLLALLAPFGGGLLLPSFFGCSLFSDGFLLLFAGPYYTASGKIVMQNGYIEIGFYIFGVFLIAQTIRHIKYLNSFYGGKYPLMLVGASFIYPIFAVGERGYFVQISDFYVFTILLWLIYIFIRLIVAFKNSEMWQSAKSGYKRGRDLGNYQIGGQSLERSASGKKKAVFGRAAAPPPPRPKKETNTSVPSKAKKAVVSKSAPRTTKDSTARSACYNCRYWTGNRQLLSAAGNFIEYEDASAKCAPGGGRQHTKVSPRATCNSFEKQFG